MTRSARGALLFAAATGGASPPRDRPVAATIDTTLTTRGEQIRQLAFDGDEVSFFASQQPPGADDHFTLVLDEPVRLRSIAAIIGRADGGDAVRAGTFAVSADGATFRQLARFAGGTARVGPAGGTVRAIRIKPGPADGPVRRQPGFGTAEPAFRNSGVNDQINRTFATYYS